MRQYPDLLRLVLEKGPPRTDRTGTGTLSVFGAQTRFDLRSSGPGFPLLTTKKLHVKSIVYELLWFLRGDTNIKYLNEHGVRIWDEWADENGDLGPVYGHQWRSWPAADGRCIDQIANVVDEIRRNPNSRRLIVTAWNPPRIRGHAPPAMPLPVPVQRRQRRAVMPTLSALGRRVSRRAVQHRLLRAVDACRGARNRP